MNISKIIKELKSPYKEIALANQIKQGNKPNDELMLGEGVENGGFKWSKSNEGYDFWFDIFYGRYPELTDEIKDNYPDIFNLV
tara:strand:- start:1562 stop:1810 length:249 start_codon:yes stop_codon:yes gene_type:complete